MSCVRSKAVSTAQAAQVTGKTIRNKYHFIATMQRVIWLTRAITSLRRCLPSVTTQACSHFSTLQSNIPGPKLLTPYTTIMNQVCGFKVKGRLKRRCQSCYFVVRDQRLYVICPKHPRHKAMAMKPKPHNTWILTHASQSPVRPW